MLFHQLCIENKFLLELPSVFWEHESCFGTVHLVHSNNYEFMLAIHLLFDFFPIAA